MIELTALLGIEWDSIKYDLGIVVPMVFLGLIAYFM